MGAHKKSGEFYKALSDTDRKDFEEIRRIRPSKEHREWLINKFKNLELDYSRKCLIL